MKLDASSLTYDLGGQWKLAAGGAMNLAAGGAVDPAAGEEMDLSIAAGGEMDQ